MASRKRMNLTNASSRSVKSFFSISHENVDGGSEEDGGGSVQMKRMEADFDSEVENEMKKMTYYFYCIHPDCTVCFITEDNFLYCV